MLRPFHVAFPVYDLDSTRHFYETVLGCSVGRTAPSWIDFNLFGHQITAHRVSDMRPETATNVVDGHGVPVSHWGVILTPTEWLALAERLTTAQVNFLIEPHQRFVGQVGEQSTLFIVDPSGNALEFKAFAQDQSIFAAAKD